MVEPEAASERLSELVRRLQAEEKVVITKDGRAVARLGALPQEDRSRRPGGWKGRVAIAEDFDALHPEDLRDVFESGP